MAVEQPETSEKKPWALKRIAGFGVLGITVLASITIATLYATGVLGPANLAAAESEKAEAIYVPIEPAFTVNFHSGETLRFLQVGVDLMTRAPAVEEAIKHHLPAIRNELVLLFSAQTAADLATSGGKEALRRDALLSVQDILLSETGEHGVEAVYFTSFVMQ